jgi:hypothetical protein
MNARLHEPKEMEEEVSIFVSWKLILRYATNGCWIGLKTGTCQWAFRE